MDVLPTSISSSKATSRRINTGYVDQRTSDCPGIVRASGLFSRLNFISTQNPVVISSQIISLTLWLQWLQFFLSFDGSTESNDKAYFYLALFFDTGVRDCLASPSPCSSLCSSLLHTFPRIIPLLGMTISKNRCLQRPLWFFSSRRSQIKDAYSVSPRTYLYKSTWTSSKPKPSTTLTISAYCSSLLISAK